MIHETTPIEAEGGAVAPLIGGGSGARRRWVLPAITGVAGFLLGAATLAGALAIEASVQTSRAATVAANTKTSEAAAEAASARILPVAVDKCGLSGDDDVLLGDGGFSLTVNHHGNDDFNSGINNTDLDCLTSSLGMPSAAKSHMQQTTSMDGRQTETWDKISVSWSYHPDRGEDSIFTVTR